jgi:hypothetical protein
MHGSAIYFFSPQRPDRLQADHSPPSSAEVKKSGAVPPLPHTSSCIVINLLSIGTTLPYPDKHSRTELTAIFGTAHMLKNFENSMPLNFKCYFP